MNEQIDAQLQLLRDRILTAALPHIPFDGWTNAGLQAGATDAGLEAADVMRAFPRGPVEAIEHHSELADRRMTSALAGMDLPSMRIRDRVSTVIRTRLQQNVADREAIRRALTILALPPNGGAAARALYRTVDTIWHVCGDTATDFNFYTKRALLAPVYSGAVLYWLSDTSEGFADTWSFVDRRIDDVMLIPRLQADVGRLFRGLPDPFRLLPTRIFRGATRARWQ